MPFPNTFKNLGPHANRKKAEEARTKIYEEEAILQNELHSYFFGRPNIPIREIRKNLDSKLTLREIREIYVDKDD